MNSITYEGVEYPIREVRITNDNEELDEIVTVASEALGSALLNVDWEPKDKEASYIDDEIYCYVPQEMLEKPQEELDKYVNENFI